MADTRKCKELTKAGRPCSAAHYRDGWCRWHHPDLEAQRQAERIAGGMAKANTARAKKKVMTAGMELSAVDGALCQALVDVLSGDLEPNIGTAAAGIARAIASVRTTSDLEARLTALEARADAHKEGWIA